jgi:hypothetical protein
MTYRFGALLLVAAFVHGPAAKAGQTAGDNNCQTVSGAVYLSADDGVILSAGKTRYQIDQAPKALEEISIKNLVEGVNGTYRICPTGAHDRFGLAVVNIVNFANLSYNTAN